MRDYAQDTNNGYFEDEDPQQGFFSRVAEKIRHRVFGEPEDEEYDEVQQEAVKPEPAPFTAASGTVRQPAATAATSALTMDQAKPGNVCIRRTISKEEDVRAAAKGLMKGEQQIINLERCPSVAAEEIINFLSGVCFALEGSSEKVGDKVFLFVPATVEVRYDNQEAGKTANTSTQRKTTFEPRSGTL
jgi:cell division inhibitor SepF